MTRRWLLLLLIAALIGFGVYAYQTAKPYVHPIKQADAVRIAAHMAERRAEAARAAAPPAAAPVSADTPAEQAPAGEWFGRAQVVDGDRIRIDNSELHFWGIDAPELDQNCDRAGRPWRCGEFAKAELERLIGGRTVACRPEGADGTPERPTVLCFVRETLCAGDQACETIVGSLNLAMIDRGAAVDIEGHFMDNEEDAREARRGLWGSRFKKPWEWRGVEQGH